MANLNIDFHLVTLILIMLVCGAFGGFLNYLHNFDTTENEQRNNVVRFKYILLGIGAAFLIPVFLKMISSNLIASTDNNDYLIFAGFCLIAAIFSRRFIVTIGDKILEAAKKAEKAALESNKKSEATQLELSSAKDRIETVKLAVDIQKAGIANNKNIDENPKALLFELANSYVEKTSVPDYTKRINLKAELGRKMGEIIVRNNLSKEELLESNQSEGMIIALAYAIQLRPDKNALIILNKISQIALQLHSKYSILVGYDSLARNSLITKGQVQEIYKTVNAFRNKADNSLLQKIDDTNYILSLIESESVE